MLAIPCAIMAYDYCHSLGLSPREYLFHPIRSCGFPVSSPPGPRSSTHRRREMGCSDLSYLPAASAHATNPQSFLISGSQDPWLNTTNETSHLPFVYIHIPISYLVLCASLVRWRHSSRQVLFIQTGRSVRCFESPPARTLKFSIVCLHLDVTE